MREFDTIGLRLATEQAEVFEASSEALNSSSEIFIKNFMHSNYVKRFDDLTIINYPFTINDAFEEYHIEYPNDRGNIKYTTDELYWIGYIYRYWSYIYEKSSKEIYKTIKPGELRGLYFSYHTLDPKGAIDRILESKGIDYNDQIKRGIEIYREILNREK